MAKEKKSKKNVVRIVGYLKENSLEEVQNNEGKDVIRGSVIISTSDIASHKVQFYMNSVNWEGEQSSDYEALHALLPENTVTVASFLKDNPGATFEQATAAATRVWCLARFDEFASMQGESCTSIISNRGWRMGEADPTKTFNPCAEFTTDVYINKITSEVVYADEDDEDGQETGRIILNCLIEGYDSASKKALPMQMVDFVCPVEDGIADHVKKHYKEGETAMINGDLISIMEKTLIESEDDGNHFGKAPSGPQYETKFIRERLMLGGSTTSAPATQPGSFTKTDVKEGLAARIAKAQENGKKRSERASQEKSAQESSIKKGFAETPSNGGSEDLDF